MPNGLEDEKSTYSDEEGNVLIDEAVYVFQQWLVFQVDEARNYGCGFHTAIFKLYLLRLL